jgi:hypothetical protein
MAEINRRLVVVLIALAAGVMFGWLWRDHQLASSQITYTDVLVRQKVNDRRFLMQPARMAAIDSQLCPESTVDWHPSETLADWTFEQKYGCKRVISYHRPLQGELNALLSLR